MSPLQFAALVTYKLKRMFALKKEKVTDRLKTDEFHDSSVRLYFVGRTVEPQGMEVHAIGRVPLGGLMLPACTARSLSTGCAVMPFVLAVQTVPGSSPTVATNLEIKNNKNICQT
jgi:hypothetical protein